MKLSIKGDQCQFKQSSSVNDTDTSCPVKISASICGVREWGGAHVNTSRLDIQVWILTGFIKYMHLSAQGFCFVLFLQWNQKVSPGEFPEADLNLYFHIVFLRVYFPGAFYATLFIATLDATHCKCPGVSKCAIFLTQVCKKNTLF